MTGFLPGLEIGDDLVLDEPDALPPEGFPVSNRKIPTPGFKPEVVMPAAHGRDSFSFRVEHFLRGLSSERRAKIALRPRFARLPWVRLANEADDDFLP